MYGPAIGVTYHDADDPQVQAAYADLLTALADDGRSLPLVVLDGRLLFSGAIDPLRVVAAVAEAWQAQTRSDRATG